MKQLLLNRYCSTRKGIDKLARQLGLSNIGAREDVMNRINSVELTYKELKTNISAIK